MIQLNRVVKISASILDVESTKALFEFGRQLDSHFLRKILTNRKNSWAQRLAMGAKAKHRYTEQLTSIKQHYEYVKKNLHFLKKKNVDWWLVPRNQRIRTPTQPLPNREFQRIIGQNFQVLGTLRPLAKRNLAQFRTNQARLKNEAQLSHKS